MSDPGVSVPKPPREHPCPPATGRWECDYSVFDESIDHWMAMNRHGIRAWTRMWQGLACHEPYATMSDCYMGWWSGYFAWLKALQTFPGVGGSGRGRGRYGVVKAGAPPIKMSWVVDRNVANPLYPTAFVDKDGFAIPANDVSADATPVAGQQGQTTITVTFSPKPGTRTGTYGGSILNDRYRLVIGPIRVDIPPG